MAAGIENVDGVKYASGQPYFDNILTNFFLQNLPDALNKSTVLVDMIEKRPKVAISGNNIIWPVNYGRNTGHSRVGYGSDIPDPSRRPAKTAGTQSRKEMARIKLDGDTLRHGKTNGGAYYTALASEMESALGSMALARAREVHNDGSGRLAEISSISTTTITLKVNSSIEGAANTRAAGTLENYFEEGMRIAACTSGGVFGVTAGGQTGFYVVNVSVSGSNVTIQVSLTAGGAALDTTGIATPWAAGNWIVTAGTETAAAVSTGLRHEMLGIGGIFSDIGPNDGLGLTAAQQQMVAYSVTGAASPTGQFQGIACAGNLWNQGIVVDNGGASRPMTEALLQQTLSDAERINNANVTLILSHHAAYDAYVALLTIDKRYVNTTELKGGHTTLSFNGIGWVKDRHAYQNRVDFLALDQIEIGVTQELTSLQIEDETVWHQVPNKDEWYRGWVRDDQLIVTGVRNRCGARLCDLSA